MVKSGQKWLLNWTALGIIYSNTKRKGGESYVFWNVPSFN